MNIYILNVGVYDLCDETGQASSDTHGWFRVLVVTRGQTHKNIGVIYYICNYYVRFIWLVPQQGRSGRQLMRISVYCNIIVFFNWFEIYNWQICIFHADILVDLSQRWKLFLCYFGTFSVAMAHRGYLSEFIMFLYVKVSKKCLNFHLKIRYQFCKLCGS